MSITDTDELLMVSRGIQLVLVAACVSRSREQVIDMMQSHLISSRPMLQSGQLISGRQCTQN